MRDGVRRTVLLRQVRTQIAMRKAIPGIEAKRLRRVPDSLGELALHVVEQETQPLMRRHVRRVQRQRLPVLLDRPVWFAPAVELVPALKG
jgi:hypothetical protein